jgi:dihydrofolate synthase / folylpolyglutamate synthase
VTGYRQAVDALQARGRFGIRLGLGRTRALLHALGDPHRAMRGALVAGTNGKGSVQAMAAAALQAAGYRVGQMPSPHLVSYRERITVAGTPIAAEDFAAIVSEVLDREARIAGRLGHATEFELLTAAAFAWFARSQVDLAVVEVGIGGRLDATNAWDGGVAAITNIDWDHADRLGNTLAAIGAEKAAIIKRGDRAVTGASGDGLTVIRRRAQAMGVPLREVAPFDVTNMDRAGVVLAAGRYGELRVSLLGRHQAANAAMAVATLEELNAAGIANADAAAIRDGLAQTHWPGRLELLAVDPSGTASPAPRDAPDPLRPDLLLDGAHNAAGVRSLAAAYAELSPSLSPGRPTMLFGLMGDKDVPAMAEELAASTLAEARIIATSVGGSRAMPAADLATVLREHVAAHDAGERAEIVAAETLDEGVRAALDSTRREGGPLIVAGSLYLVGDVRARLYADPSLQDPAEQS